MFHHKKRRWPWVLLILVLLLGGFAFAAIRWFQTVSPVQVLENERIQDTIVQAIGEQHRETIELMPTFLGFGQPRTYLILFLNNNEMRPGGGFIGSYATLRFSNGSMEILALEGTETLDNAAPEDWVVEPPEMIQQQLGLSRWFFRDSNWNIDFTENAKRAKEFYIAEQGAGAEDIDMVIAFTPNVLEEILKITGPVSVEGIEFTSENIQETIEYQVQYGFQDRGDTFARRKDILQPLFQEVVRRTGETIFFSPKKFEQAILKLVEEKHVLGYSETPEFEAIIQQYGAEGSVNQNGGDYLQWVDANLAALKTDYAIERNLDYSIQRVNDAYIAKAQMNYVHTGTFDWRTSRYRTFARAYVPEGSKLLKASRIDENGAAQSIALDQIIIETESNKQSFGYFMVIEPGDTESLIFEYQLPESITANVQVGNYQLDVQKQAGIREMGLTLSLDFDKKVQVATPAEAREFWGDDTYTYQTIIKKDDWFSVGF